MNTISDKKPWRIVLAKLILPLTNEIRSISPHMIDNSDRNIKIFAADSQRNNSWFEPLSQYAVECKTCEFFENIKQQNLRKKLRPTKTYIK